MAMTHVISTQSPLPSRIHLSLSDVTDTHIHHTRIVFFHPNTYFTRPLEHESKVWEGMLTIRSCRSIIPLVQARRLTIIEVPTKREKEAGSNVRPARAAGSSEEAPRLKRQMQSRQHQRVI